MGDHQRGAALGGLIQRLLHQTLVGRVERGGGFVQQHHGRAAHKRARNRDALALAAGKLAALGADFRRKPATAFKKGESLGLLQGLADFFLGRIRAAEADVAGGIAREDRRFLRHIGKARTPFGRIHLARVEAVKRHRARLRIEETQQHAEHGRLARA